MQTQLLPCAITDQIDSINRGFLWGDSETKRKPHHVSWSTVCASKDRGGLGLRSARNTNYALLAKLGWRVLKKDGSPWCVALRAKYLRRHDLWNAKKPSNASGVWSSILASRSLLRKGVRWRIGQGSAVSFWDDVWVGPEPLSRVVGVPPAPIPASASVSDLVADGSWNIALLSVVLPAGLVDEIRAIPIPLDAQVDDELFWGASTTGSFTVRSAYDILRDVDFSADRDSGKWNWIWQLPSSEKIKHFIWLIVHNRLLTNLSRFSRHMGITPLCQQCGTEEESVLHLLRDCQCISSIWQSRSPTFFSEQNPFTWLRRHARDEDGMHFLAIVWHIWRAPNLYIFEHKNLPVQAIQNQAHIYYQDTVKAFANRAPSSGSRTLRFVSWLPPPPGCVKLNTDGSRLDTGYAAAGGLLRDHLGTWISGFVVNIGITSSYNAELWGLLHGLRLCRSLNIQNLEVELDSAVIVGLLAEQDAREGTLSTLLLECFAILRTFQHAAIRHTLREGNRAADFLANLGHLYDPGISIFDLQPQGISSILFSDQMGLVFPRL